MKKDTIYIDTEDDITSIIEKVKVSGEKIIALVPPKRVGVLQSAVNLKLLQKSAQTADKRIVLITHDKALASLAAGISIPVAKNLQSRPELAAIAEPEVDEAEDVINGEDLPVGELEKTSALPTVVDPEDEIELPEDLAEATPKSKSLGPKKSKAKKAGPQVPNFNIFRKKLFLIIGGGILLLAFLVWAIWFAPHATVNIKAKTTAERVDFPVGLNVNGTTDAKAKIIKPAVQQIKKTSSIDFDTTGKKDVGEKATGTVTISNCDTNDPITVSAGTAISSNGLNFMTASTVTVPGAHFGGGNCTKAGNASVSVQAQNVGDNYNLASGSDFTVSGQNPTVSATNSSAFTGGSKRTINVVSDGDIAAAQAKLVAQNGEAGRAELTNDFDSKQYVIIDKSYKAVPSAVTSSPASGGEGAKGHLTVEITYTLLAMSKDDVNGILNAYLNDKIAQQKNQKIYDNGLNKLKLENYSDASVTFKTNGYIGPAIDTAKLKPQLVGKNYEDIRQKIKTIDGVDDVDTQFFPFWVSSAPDAGKIDIKFVIQNNG